MKIVRASAGFSLIELAVGMVILGLLLSGGLLVVSKKWMGDQREATRQYLRDVKKELLTYARDHGRLPMMDFNKDGNADPCPLNADYANKKGYLPYKTLGVKGVDPYGVQVDYVTNWQLAKGEIAGDENRPCNALKNYYRGYVQFALPIGSTRRQPNWLFFRVYPGWNHTVYNVNSDWDNPTVPVSQNFEPTAGGALKGTPNWFPNRGVALTYVPYAVLLISPAAAGGVVGLHSDTIDASTLYYDDGPAKIDIVETISLSELYSALGCSN